MTEKLLVVAANGRVASRVVARLSDAGQRPDAIVRNADKARDLLVDSTGEPTYEKLVVGELTDQDLLRSALTGIDVAFLALGSNPDQVALEKNVIDAARAVGLPHLVKLSSALAAHDAVSSVLRLHAEIEDHLVASGVEHTLISPSSFMEIALLGAPSIRENQRWVGTAPDGTNALIDSRDVVDAVATVMLDATKRGGTYVLTGPEALSWPDVATALTTVLGRTITYDAVTVDERRSQIEAAGLEPWRVELLLGLDDINRYSVYAEPTEDFTTLTGRRPRDITEFLQAHRGAFAPASS